MRSFFVFLTILFFSACSSQRAVKFEQVYSGTNGPTRVSAQYFSAQEELDNSWIKGALEGAAYRKLLAQVDFSKQVVVAFTAGEVRSFSGKIVIASIYQYTGVKDLPINLRVKLGVLRNECKVSKMSLPFVVAVMERPLEFRPVGGFDIATFDDGCSESS